MKQFTVIEIEAEISRYQRTPELRDNLRLGQHLMNALLPTESNPDIFYCVDDDKALKMFVDAYWLGC